MSSVLPLPSFKDATRGLHVPSLKETSLDRDQYLLRLAQTVRMDLASSLGIDISEAGSLESWVEEAESSGWHVFLDDDEDDEGYGGDGTDSTKSQQVTGKSAGLTSECQKTSDTTEDKARTISLHKESLQNIGQHGQPSNTDNPRKRCAGNTHYLDLCEDSLNTNSQEGCIIEEHLSSRCLKRQCLA